MLRSPTEAELPAVFEMTVEAFAEHWGAVRGGRAAPRRVDREPGASGGPGGRRLEGRRAGRDGERRAGDAARRLGRRPARGVCTHPRHRRLGLARAASSRACAGCATPARPERYLGVDTDNQNRAYALYESCGFHVATSSTSYRKPFTAGGHLMHATSSDRARSRRRRSGPDDPGPRVPPARPRRLGRARRRHQPRPGRPTASTRSSGPTRCAPSTSRWRVPSRPRRLARRDRRTSWSAWRSGARVQRMASLALESWGAVLAEHRHQGIGTALHRATRDRLAVEAAADPRPGERAFRSCALDIERSDMALLRDEGYAPIRFGFEMRRFLTGHAARAPAPRRPRAPAGHARPAPGDLRRRQRGVPRPLGPPRAGRGRLPRPLRASRDGHRRCGASPGTATRSPGPW